MSLSPLFHRDTGQIMMYCMSHQVTCSLCLYDGACLTRRPQRWDSISHAQQSSQAGWPWSQPPPRPGCICPRTPCRTAWSWGREQTVEAHAKPDIRFSAQLNDLPGSNWWLNVVARWGFELGWGPDDLGCTLYECDIWVGNLWTSLCAQSTLLRGLSQVYGPELGK